MRIYNIFFVRLIVLCFMVLFSGQLLAVDWWPEDSLAMPIKPQENALQNPPVFSWPASTRSGSYEVSLTNSVGQSKVFLVSNNWLQLDAPLASGNYRWCVRLLSAARNPVSEWSSQRTFSIDDGAKIFIVPDAIQLIRVASQRARPRSLPSGDGWIKLELALHGERAVGIKKLRERMQSVLGASLPIEPTQPFDSIPTALAKIRAIGEFRNGLNTEQERILTLGLLWHLDGERKWANEGVKRAVNLASWKPRGTTGLVAQNQSTRTILLSLAVAYDMFYKELTNEQKKLILSAIRVRYADLYEKIVATGYLSSHPYDPWASYTLGYLVSVAPLVAGDLPEAVDWFREALPLYTAVFPAWSGDDGGYGNGIAYGLWDVPESILLWDTLQWSTGFNFYEKPAIFNFGLVMAHFLPFGSPIGEFGDGAENNMRWSIDGYGKTFAARTPTQLTDWYSHQLAGGDSASFVTLTSPVRAENSTFIPEKSTNSLLLKSVGWVAMHSDLSDPSRSSVFFKSSPFGSLNHSHADQNSFVLHSHGQVLAMDSGYYDYYNSPHWRDWYKQTRAHNAITFDGGQGQSLGEYGLGSKLFAGKITRYETSVEYDVVTGDATGAYGGQLSEAKRTLVFIRPSTLVVIDQLASLTPKQWEWNLHTPAPLMKNGNGYKLDVVGAELCVAVASSQPMNMTSTSGYIPAPQISTPVSPHFWSRFSYISPQKTGLIVSVLRMDCSSPEPVVSMKSNEASIKFGAHLINVVAGAVAVN